MGMGSELNNTGIRIKELLGAVGQSVKPSHWKEITQEAAQKGPGVVKAGGGIIGASAKAGFNLATAPLGLLMKPVNRAIHVAGQFILKHPRASWGLAAAGTAMGIGSMAAKARSQQLQAQGEALAQMQAMQAAAQPSYMNSVSADEAALLDAKQKQGSATANHAESIAAARSQQAAAPEATPTPL